MARLFQSGAEIDAGAASFVTATTQADPDGQRNVTSVTRDTTVFRSGVASWKCDSGIVNGPTNVVSTAVAFVDGRSYFVRGYFRTSQVPSAAASILGLGISLATGIYARFRTDGALELLVNSAVQGSPSSAINDSAWHRVELKGTATATTTWTAAELLLDGVSVATWSGSVTRGTAFAFGLGVRPTDAPGTSRVVNVDDVAVNDSTGAANTSYPGDGKVVLLKPVTDNAVGTGWTLGTGTAMASNSGSTAVKNTQPVGVADLAAGSDVKQIRNASSNASVSYDANMTTYTAAGVGASDTVNAVIPWVATAAPLGTSAKAGTVGVASNPTIANISLGATGTAGAFWGGVVGGSYGAGWKWSPGTVAGSPTVTLGTGPVMRITQVTASTRIAMVCFMGIYVDYTPVVSGTAWTQPVNDTLSLADAVASQSAFSPTIPDTLAVADATVVARDIAQAIVDTVTLADAAVSARDIAQSVADTLAVSDLVDPVKTTGGVALTQPVTDTVSVADALLFDRTQTVTDTVAVADTLASQAVLARTLADTVSMADTLAYQAALLRTIADTVGLTDLTTPVKSTGAVDWAQPVADTVTVADQIAYQAALARTIADTVAVTDATLAERGLTRALADTLAVADQLASLAERNLTVADTITLGDLVTSQAELQRLVADSVAITDELLSDLHIPVPLPAGWITFASGDRIGVLYPGRLDTAAQTLGGISVPGQGEGELALTGVGGIATTGG